MSFRFFVRSIALAAIPFYTLIIPTRGYANVPRAARLFHIDGPPQLTLRRNSQHGPAPLGSVMRHHPDALIVPGSGRTTADLRFYGDYDRDLGFYVRAITQTGLQTLYYFPCEVRSGNAMIMEWQNSQRRGCERGYDIQRWSRQSSKIFGDEELALDSNSDNPGYLGRFYSHLKANLLAQTRRRRQFNYTCVVNDTAGRGWFNAEESAYPCQQPLKECISQNSPDQCSIATQERWQTRGDEVTAILACADNQTLTATSNRNDLAERLAQLWQQRASEDLKYCGLHLVATQEVSIIPAKRQRVVVRTKDTGVATAVEVLVGSVTIRTASEPQGVEVLEGERYIYSGPSDEATVETFDAQAELQSLEIRDFLAASQPPPVPVGNPADAQYIVGALDDGEYQFCTGPEPPPGTFPEATGVCFYFSKASNNLIGTYGYPHSDNLIACVSGTVNENIMTGEALDVSGYSIDWSVVPPPEEVISWDENGFLTISGARLLDSYTDEFGNDISWIKFDRAVLDLNGFYRYSQSPSSNITSNSNNPVDNTCTIDRVRESWGP